VTELGERRGIFGRLGLGATVILLAAASATAVAAFHEVDKIVEAFKTGDSLDLGDELAEADAGKPQTIMLIGSDKRAETSQDAQIDSGARSDTVMLVRLDPSRDATALMSLPRDLKVKIPGHGTDKLNAAYTYGGPKLTLQTVKELTGLRINHVINVDFRAFRKAVDQIGCVYTDVDRRYYNDNTGPGENYATINVPQGYQRLCGQDALDYVRFRHEDNDLVRGARQQEFLRQAKQQVGVGRLIDDRDKLVKIFGKYTRSDIRSRKSVLRLLKLVVASAGHPIQEVHFEGEIGESYVTASSKRVRKLTQQFLGVEATKGPRGELKRPNGKKKKRKKIEDSGLEDASAAGRAQAEAVALQDPDIPIFYPRQRTRQALYAGEPRVYTIKSPGGKKFDAYRMVIKRNLVGEYYGLQGTEWREPPILKDPSEKREMDGREFELHYDGDRLRLVAWRTDEGSYWVSNSLLQTLSEKQMLAIARSAREL
jgi:LCP family protein required for cell wall assembly